ncbi:hypothetical protein HP456_00630 [Bacillus haikouensis]|uniref:hypothetical protein n=1 Tax=Bacillus haikouensis TaxID=1510468 RepID=UPI001553CDCC|nr:hypothetical protein [Bacillus haikouensis]NQD64426.1 hypothetical protein [Bacillus haikouensis]
MRKILLLFTVLTCMFTSQYKAYANETFRWVVDFKNVSDESQTIMIKNTGSKVHAVKAEVKEIESNGTETPLVPYITKKNVKGNETLSVENVKKSPALIVKITWRDKLMKMKSSRLASGEKKTFILEKRGNEIIIK